MEITERARRIAGFRNARCDRSSYPDTLKPCYEWTLNQREWCAYCRALYHLRAGGAE